MAPPAHPRHRFQFRLRTLFVVVTFVALACGWAVDHPRLISERDDVLFQRDDILQDKRIAEEKVNELTRTILTLVERLFHSSQRIEGLEERSSEKKSNSPFRFP